MLTIAGGILLAVFVLFVVLPAICMFCMWLVEVLQGKGSMIAAIVFFIGCIFVAAMKQG